jgi:transcriptional regulator with XRE-family HTH domain
MTNSRVQSNKNLREFGKRLWAYRDAKGISRNNLAKSICVSPQHIWRLENGFRGCSRDLAIILCSRLNLNIEQINTLLTLAGHCPIKKRGDTRRSIPPLNSKGGLHE